MKATPKPVRMKEVIRMLSEERQLQGLCLSCAYASGCTYPRDPERPILQCDECDAGDFHTLTVCPEPFPTEIVTLLPARSLSVQQKTESVKGLCGLCEDRSTCTYPKPEGGVWHCEEYR